jgi:tripartite-type tricarboxylate transporter receptor subunit TctC
MKKMIISSLAISIGICVLLGEAWAQTQPKTSAIDYPTKPIQVIVPYAAGGGTDIVARLIAHYLKNSLGQPMAIVNRPGAAGALGHREIAHAEPDGYTLGVLSYPDSAINPKGESSGFRNEDFVPLATFTRTPSVLAVKKDGPFKTMTEFGAYAKKNPGSITVAVGGQAHLLCVILIEQAMGIKLNPVMFKGGSEAMKTLMGGHTMAAVAASQYIVEDAEGKGVLPIALTGEKRHEAFRNVPTFKELSYDVPIDMMRILCTPKGVSPAIHQKLLPPLLELDKNQEFIEKVKGSGELYSPLFGKELEEYYRKTNATLSVTVEKYKDQFTQ